MLYQCYIFIYQRVIIVKEHVMFYVYFIWKLIVVHSIAGPHVVFFGLNVVEVLALLLTFKPFLTERKTPS